MSNKLPGYLFPINLKRLRRSMNFTQEQLAERCDVSKNYISQLEMGSRFPSFTMLDTLCQVLNIKAYELFIEDDDFYKVMVVNKDDFAFMDSLKNYIGRYMDGKKLE
jgi:transcriptional regulator with XRE-family HTH domain